jgi:hypothetical protein
VLNVKNSFVGAKIQASTSGSVGWQNKPFEKQNVFNHLKLD